jgi:hypothetical protein
MGRKTILNHLEFDFEQPRRPLPVPARAASLPEELEGFAEFGAPTQCSTLTCPLPGGGQAEVPVFVNEFWTAQQRACHSLHEVSYRACFKPQLPRFFIQRLTQSDGVVYDPFMGRGTTLIEAALLGRIPHGNDINPLSVRLVRPRLNPPPVATVQRRLAEIDFTQGEVTPEDLLVFYHPDTLREINALRHYLFQQQRHGRADAVDDWIAMVALNRLTGHSPGFFSVYTMPPNQAVSVKSQIKINARRNQKPPRRHVPELILKKSRKLLGEIDDSTLHMLRRAAAQAVLLTEPAHRTPQIRDQTVDLIVTSPPFLDVVNYATDNWLRCWFLGIDAQAVPLTVPSGIESWQQAMSLVFQELGRVLKPGGHVAFEVGEVNKGQTKLEEIVLPVGAAIGLRPVLLLVNDQKFTKTANCWGVSNNARGTNTNRVVLFQKG